MNENGEDNAKASQNRAGNKKFFRVVREQGKFVKDTEFHYKKHLKKAKHDLFRAGREFSDSCWDWTVIKAYYALFHAGNALLSKKKGVFSKDHSCLIVALRYWNLVPEPIFIKLKTAYEGISDIADIDIAFQIRKISQYDVDLWEEITEDNARVILDIAKEMVKFAEDEIYGDLGKQGPEKGA